MSRWLVVAVVIFAATDSMTNDGVNNKLSFKRTESVSADGKTMTVTTVGPNTEGRMVNSVAVYEKQ